MFTWVDGVDASWRADYDQWHTAVPSEMGNDARDPARYRDNGELRFALRSIRAFAPWVRRIHLVTAGHAPRWLRADAHGIHVVPHRRIFAARDLPTFNSHAIEARLHHIPGLAEHFIYFNDDVFLARHQPPANFFDDAGIARVPMAPSARHRIGGWTDASCDRSARNGIRLIEQDIGTCPSCRPRHGPFPQRRSHLFELEARFGPQLHATASNRFRAPNDVSLPSFLAPMHGLATGQVRRSPAHVEEINVDDTTLIDRLRTVAPGTIIDAFCLNDTERVPPGPHGPRHTVTTFLQRRFPGPGPWETSPGSE